MSYTLIPFGYDPEQDRFLAISEVANGSKCGCICPSCKVPLIAKHPSTDIVWHFAHSSKAIYNEVRAKCEYNFYLSLRMFCRQVMHETFDMVLPDCYREISAITSTLHRKVVHRYKVAERSKVHLENIQVETIYKGIHVDFVAEVQGRPLVIYLTHPNRPFPVEFKTIEHYENDGILEIDLSYLYLEFNNKDSMVYTHFLEHVKNHLQHSTNSKLWYFHPREPKFIARAEEELNFKVKQEESQTQTYNNPNSLIDRLRYSPSISHKYRCKSCLTEWDKREGYICPFCYTKFS